MLGKLYAAYIRTGLKLGDKIMNTWSDYIAKSGGDIRYLNAMRKGAVRPNAMWRCVASIAERDGFIPAFRYRVKKTVNIFSEFLNH